MTVLSTGFLSYTALLNTMPGTSWAERTYTSGRKISGHSTQKECGHTRTLALLSPLSGALTSVTSISASRSYSRDTELQLYLYSTCPNFSSMLSTETSHLYSTSIPVDYKRLTEGEFKLSPGARILSRVFKTFL